MILPPGIADADVYDRLAGRQMRVGIFANGSLFAEHLVAPGTDLILGAGAHGVTAVPRWTGIDVCLISKGRWLLLGPGMAVHMCHETGEERMQGSFEELSQAGVRFPFHINVSKLNISVRPGVVVLVHYVE